MKEDKFTPAEGVTLENHRKYVDAIERAVYREIKSIPLEERSAIITMVIMTLLVTAKCLMKFKDELEAKGEAPPVTEDQQLTFRLMLKRLFQKDPKTS